MYCCAPQLSRYEYFRAFVDKTEWTKISIEIPIKGRKYKFFMLLNEYFHILD